MGQELLHFEETKGKKQRSLLRVFCFALSSIPPPRLWHSTSLILLPSLFYCFQCYRGGRVVEPCLLFFFFLHLLLFVKRRLHCSWMGVFKMVRAQPDQTHEACASREATLLLCPSHLSTVAETENVKLSHQISDQISGRTTST